MQPFSGVSSRLSGEFSVDLGDLFEALNELLRQRKALFIDFQCDERLLISAVTKS